MESKIFLYNSLIGQRLKFYRKKMGLTQAALAKLIDISAQQLQKYEIGKNRVSASRLKFIAEILDTPVHYFLTDPKEPAKDKKYTTETNADNGIGRLVYYYSHIKSEKVKKHLILTSAIYVENGL